MIDRAGWTGESIGQKLGKVIIESETPPTCAYTDITETNDVFTQRVFDGKFGAWVTYAELCYIRGLLNELGDYGKAAGSLSELETRKEITDIQIALVEGN